MTWAPPGALLESHSPDLAASQVSQPLGKPSCIIPKPWRRTSIAISQRQHLQSVETRTMSLPIKQVKQAGTPGPKPEQYEHRNLTQEHVLTLLQHSPSPLEFTGGVPTPHTNTLG